MGQQKFENIFFYEYAFRVEKLERNRLIGRSMRRCGSIILKWVLQKSVGRAWSGFVWLRVGKRGGLL
jgi:hypothetical protein